MHADKLRGALTWVRNVLIPRSQSRRQIARNALVTAALLGGASLVCACMNLISDGDQAVPMVFMLAVLLTARITDGYIYSLAASVVSVFGVNYAFTYPYFEFNFTITGYPFTFFTMFTVSVVVGMLTDQVKRQSRIEAEAEAEKMKANLLRSVSHDLRTPLTTISGNASNLLSNGDSFDEATKRRLYSDIYDDAMWLISLVENLLSATRIEEGRMSLRTSTELLSDIIEEALRHIRRKASDHPLTTVYTDDLLLVRADARLVVQVIVNIVDNALKYTPPGSRIDIAASRADGMAQVRICDTGPGIPDAEKAKIFDKFYCGENRIADNRRSLGLGLYLCKAIVEAHGGAIRVEDNAPHGTVFSFTLPLGEVTLHE